MDCRWLHIGGAGRATELLLRGLRESEPIGRWRLWGPPAVRAYLWEASEWLPSSGSPKRLWGQRDAFRIPEADVTIYPHHIRPLRPGPSVTLVHDTIPLRFAKDPITRLLAKPFLRMVARVSSRILTVSLHSRASVQRDLGVTASKISVVRYPVDREMVARVQRLREELPRRDVGIFVGRFAPHKDLPALLAAFQATSFRRRGGGLLLMGGTAGEVKALTELVRRRGLEGVVVEGSTPQSALEEAYATSRFLVLPSLEEGFGLPVWEAMACGLPVCVSDGGALPEITEGIAMPFRAGSIAEMAIAIDRAAEERISAPADLPAPSLGEFADAFVEEAARALIGDG